LKNGQSKIGTPSVTPLVASQNSGNHKARKKVKKFIENLSKPGGVAKFAAEFPALLPNNIL
jgi:hypothetical protein